MIKAVTLDVAGTLIKPSAPVGAIYMRIAALHGASLDAQKLDQGFKSHFPTMPPMSFGQVASTELDGLERDWWRDLVRKVTDDAGGIAAFDGFFDELYEYFATAQAWSVFPEVDEFLLALSARGIATAVVSNFDSRLIKVLDALDLSRRVGPIIFSTAAGSAKPHADIFAQALLALDIRAEVCLHIGDDRRTDLEGATQAGLAARLLMRDSAQQLNAPYIGKLTEALTVLI